MDRWMVVYVDECVDGWMDVGWLDEWIGGWMDGWMDGKIDSLMDG
jgi:organic anion transporter 5A